MHSRRAQIAFWFIRAGIPEYQNGDQPFFSYICKYTDASCSLNIL
uniref:Uncharacterized protein n=1 Tax=Arundo donax TaxID=35708 RepID=A0A0A9B4H4_ARUDO